mgnify:FL=1
MTDRPSAPQARTRLTGWIARVDWMMLFPVVAAIAWASGQDAVAMVLAIVLPAFLALNGDILRHRTERISALSMLSSDQPLARPVLKRIVDDVLDDCARRDRTTAVLHIQVDDLHIADGGWGDRMRSCGRATTG